MNAHPHLGHSYATDATRWQAVRTRDPRADGQFVYAVRTTGVYANPSSAARLPRREHVAFFASPAAAERAGYRPSRRPRADRTPTTAHAALVTRACRAIERAASPPKLAALAAVAGLSPSHFHRVFKRATGLTPRAYAAAHRARRLHTALHAGDGSITDALYAAGYNSSSRFYATAEQVLGMQARHYRRGGAGETIRFAVGQCTLGAILVAQSARGICAILLGDDPDQLVRDLQDQFPRAELVGGDQAFEKRVAVVVGFVEAPSIGLDLPLDVRGTAFQQRVWQALRAIPPGTTVSYAALAKQIGAPKSARAVAQACGANCLAVAIPCHRVIRRNGDLAGYRWGVARKRALLRREGRA